MIFVPRLTSQCIISVSFCTVKETPAADSQMYCSSSKFLQSTRTLSKTK